MYLIRTQLRSVSRDSTARPAEAGLESDQKQRGRPTIPSPVLTISDTRLAYSGSRHRPRLNCAPMSRAARDGKFRAHTAPSVTRLRVLKCYASKRRYFKTWTKLEAFLSPIGTSPSAEKWYAEMQRRKGDALSNSQLRPERASPRKWLKGKQQ